jgi:hypothetical protein
VPTAISLARGGYGTTLLGGIGCNQSTTDVAAFLAVWRETLIRELQTNQSGFLHKHLPVLAASMLLNFPDLKFINLYLNPVTSEQEQHKGAVAIIAERGPNLVRLAQFVEEHFVWGDLAGILKRFSTCVFPGLALRELLGAACDIDHGLQPKPLSMIGKIHGQRQPSKASAHRALEVRASLVVSAAQLMPYVMAWWGSGTLLQLLSLSANGLTMLSLVCGCGYLSLFTVLFCPSNCRRLQWWKMNQVCMF